MHITISPECKNKLRAIKHGVDEIHLYKPHGYIFVVSFLLVDGRMVTLRGEEHDIAPRFEVYGLSVSDEKIKSPPDVVLKKACYQHVNAINILTKYTWDEPTSEKEKQLLLGDATYATTVFEGPESMIPANCLNRASVEAGIQIEFNDSSEFTAVTSVNPFDIAVNHAASSSEIVEADYEFEPLR